jgi:hypothetical protein
MGKQMYMCAHARRLDNPTKDVRQVRGAEVQTDQTEMLIDLEDHGSKAEATKEGIVTPVEGVGETCPRGTVAPTAQREAHARTKRNMCWNCTRLTGYKTSRKQEWPICSVGQAVKKRELCEMSKDMSIQQLEERASKLISIGQKELLP